MLNKFGQILLADSILRQDVEKDDPEKIIFIFLRRLLTGECPPDLIVDGDILIQEDRNNVLHVIFNFLSLGVCPHGKILLHFAEFVDIALVVLHALLGQVQVGGELGQLLLVLGHLLDHLTQGSHVALISTEIEYFQKQNPSKNNVFTLTGFSSLR